MDPNTWVETVLAPKIKKDPDSNEYIFPDVLDDLEYFSRLHSWYKHLHKVAVRFYPMLRIGREKKFCQDDDNDVELHWTFIDENALDNIPDLFRNNYVHFSDHLSRYTNQTCLNDVVDTQNKFLRLCVLTEIDALKEKITEFLESGPKARGSKGPSVLSTK